MKKPQAIRNKITELKNLLQEIAVWRFHNRKIIFTNGCFDILHAGHIHLLNACAEFENNAVIIVALNSDASIKRLKGESRPINTFEDRALIIATLYTTDAVIKFEEDTPYQLIELIKPDILVKGGDYKKDEIVGADLVKEYGGRVEIVSFLEGYSTTHLLEKK